MYNGLWKNLTDFCVAPPGCCNCCQGKENDNPYQRSFFCRWRKVQSTVYFFLLAMQSCKRQEGLCPKNTLKYNKWAMKSFSSNWASAWNEMLPPLKRWSLEQFPLNNDADEVCDWLCAFVKQTHKNDRGEYTPESLYLLVAGLQCKIRMKKGKLAAFNFLLMLALSHFKMYVKINLICYKPEWHWNRRTAHEMH